MKSLRPSSLVLAFAVLCAGCSRESVAYVVVFDNSGSARDQQKRFEAEFVVAFESFPPNARVTVLRTGSSTVETDSGEAGERTAESFVSALRRDTAAQDPRGGTDYAAMAEAMGNAAIRSHADRIHFIVFTDGGDDFAGEPNHRRRYESAAGDLGRNGKVASIRFVGVEPGFWEALRRTWSVAGPKLEIRK